MVSGRRARLRVRVAELHDDSRHPVTFSSVDGTSSPPPERVRRAVHKPGAEHPRVLNLRSAEQVVSTFASATGPQRASDARRFVMAGSTCGDKRASLLYSSPP